MDISYPQTGIILNSMHFIANGQPEQGRKLKTTHFRLPKETADGSVLTFEVRRGMSLTISDFMFRQDTVMLEEIQGKEIFQISFCIDGSFEWSYLRGGKEHHFLLGAQQCQVRCGVIETCHSFFRGGVRCRAVSITLDRAAFHQVFSAVSLRDALCGTDAGAALPAKTYLYTPSVSKILSEILDCPFCGEVRELYVEGKVLELIAVFCEEVICRSPANRFGMSITEKDYEALLSAREFINKNFTHPLTLTSVAKQSAVSEKKLTEGFRRCFGCTVNDYITEKRMEAAKELLLTGKYTVANVTWMVGYSHTSYFIRIFREHYGLTPGQMLKSNR